MKASMLTLLGVTEKSAESLCAIPVRFNNESPENATTISKKEERLSNRRQTRDATTQNRLSFAIRDKIEEFVANLNATLNRLRPTSFLFAAEKRENRSAAMKQQTIRRSRLRLSDFNR